MYNGWPETLQQRSNSRHGRECGGFRLLDRNLAACIGPRICDMPCDATEPEKHRIACSAIRFQSTEFRVLQVVIKPPYSEESKFYRSQENPHPFGYIETDLKFARN
jgi:hypothetical protein